MIVCPTLRWNKTYLERAWIWKDDYVFPVEPRGNLLQIIETILFVLYPSERSDLRMIDEETNLMTPNDVSKIREQLKSEKHACLYVRPEHPRSFQFSNNK